MNANTRIPSKLRFPGGYEVEVRISPRGECPHGCGKHLEDEIGDEDEGEYGLCQGKPLISIWSGLTPRQRWRKLAHEMLHALADYQLWLEQGT